MNAPYAYSVCGVRVLSDMPFEFPAAQSGEEGATVLFAEGRDEDFAGYASPQATDEIYWDERPDGAMYLWWAGLYEFSVAADGSRVACRPLNGSDRSVLQNFLFGQVFAVAMVRQRIEPLHAAVVEIDGEAVAFLGDCSFGKSTLLASFIDAGHRVVTDDMLVVERRSGEPHVMPGTGRIKLRPDSAGLFLKDAASGTPLTRMSTKRVYALDETRRRRMSVPLRTMFVLPTPEERDGSTGIEISRMRRSEMACELLKNTFAIHMVDRERLARQFDAAASLASQVDGFRLRYPTGLHHLPAVREQIFNHARALVAQCAS